MITAADEHPHPVGVEPNFNESRYFQFHDPQQQLSGFLRLAQRPNEGIGERTVCLYLPDGAVAFSFARPKVTSTDDMTAAGLSVSIAVPMETLDVTYNGMVSVVADPRAMADPKAALSTSPELACRMALTYQALAPAHEQTFDAAGQSFAPHHYEQLAAVSGALTIGTRHFTIQGHGLRDHSWGPRSWQAPWFYRWVHGSSSQLGFMVAYFGDPDGGSRRGGFVFDDGRMYACDDVRIETDRDVDGYQSTIALTACGAGREWSFVGSAVRSVPLRHRASDGSPSTRIVESAISWRCADGRALHGMAEYLDQIHDGQPVGALV